MDWSISAYDWDAMAATAVKKREPRRAEVRCQVEGCDADMQGLRPFYQRLRICETHAKAHSITDASGRSMRFCQQCSKLQPLEMFEGGHRSCAASLDKRRARRTMARVTRNKASSSDSEEEEEEEATAPQRKRRATKQESRSNSGSAGSSGEHSALPSALKSKLGARSRGSPSRRGHGAHRRRGSNDSGEVAAAGGSAAPAAREGLPGASPGASAVLFSGSLTHLAEAPVTGAAQLPPLRLPYGGASAATLPLDAAGAAQFQQAALLGGMGGSGPLLGPIAPAGPGAAGPLLQPLALPPGLGSHVPDEDELDLLLQLSPEDLADVLLAECDSHAGDNLAGGGRPLTAAALQPCSWPPAPLPVAGPATGAVSHTAALPGAAAFARSSPPAAQPQGPVGSRDSGSRGPEETMAAQHFNLHAADGNAAAFATSAGAAWPGLPGWPGQQAGDQLVTLCIKLFGTTPESLPAGLHAQLRMAMTLTPTVLQATLRHGCLCLTVAALLSPDELKRLHSAHPSGLAASVAAAVAQAQAASGTPYKLLVQAGSQLAAADAQRGVIAAQPLPTSPGSTAAQLLAAARLVTPPVLCNEGSSQPIQLVLAGPGLAAPNVTLHCRSRGQHQVVAVLRARRSSHGVAAADLQAPSTPPPADRRSADSGFESEGEGAWAPSAAGPAASAAMGEPSAAEAAFAAVDLAPGEDALLVQLAAPAQGWGLFEFEAAAGALLSRAVPLLVLPATASAAAAELASGLASMPQCDAADLLLHLGFAMQSAERGPRLQPAAVQRVSRLACALALSCDERGWVRTARLLLPAIALAAQPAEGGSSSNASLAANGKGGQAGMPGSSIAAATAGVHACKGMAPDHQQRLELLLARLAAQDEDEDAAAAPPAQHAAPARPPARLADWFWIGCNLAAGAATAVMLIRNLYVEGAP